MGQGINYPIPAEPSGPGCPNDPTQCSGYKVRQDANKAFMGQLQITPNLGSGTNFNGQSLTLQRALTSLGGYAGAVGITGNTNNGTDAIKGVCVNGVCPVTAFGATGNGTTDDTAAIQNAINTACLVTGMKPIVYLPATPNGSYLISAPLRITCSGLKLIGDGRQATKINQAFLGPAIMVQGIDVGWKTPLTTSITSVWQQSHAYTQWTDIVDANGNIEVEEASNCTSGSTTPTWPTTQPNTVADNTCTWGLATTGGNKSLVSGVGGSLDGADPEEFNGAGFGSNNSLIELGNNANLDNAINGLSNFTIEFFVEFFSNSLVGNNNLFFEATQGWPRTPFTGADELSFIPQGTSGSCTTAPCIQPLVNIGGSIVSFAANTANSSAPINKVHHFAMTYDGSTMRFFIDGNLASSGAASGNLTIPSFTSITMGWANVNGQFGGQGCSVYPGQSCGLNFTPFFLDSLRISNTARYTSTFTPPTSKLISDNNTVFLENFPATAATGTIQGLLNNSTTTYTPVPTTYGNTQLIPVRIEGMQFNDNGIWANWAPNMSVDHIWQSTSRTCINFYNNDFQAEVSDYFCGVTPSTTRSTLGFSLGNASNDMLMRHIQCDGQYGCIAQVNGQGHYIYIEYTDRSNVIMPFAEINSLAVYDNPIEDIEDTATNQTGSFLSVNGLGGPTTINGGQLFAGNNSSSFGYLVVNGGQPLSVRGVQLSGNTAGSILNDLSNTTAPSTLTDSNIPSGLANTNTGSSFYLHTNIYGQNKGMKFADLPATCSTAGWSGMSRYVTDADPAANPPVACTSAGTKTGSWADCVNNTWFCRN